MYEKQLKIAILAVKKSEKTFRKYFGTKTKVKEKNGNYLDLVSLADKKIEQEIKTYLLNRFPIYGFIGEESKSVDAMAEYTWTLDPIDGTTNYLQGLPECAISLALLKNMKPVVGVIYAPILDQLYTARRKSGSKLNGKKIHVSNTASLKMAFGSVGWGQDRKFGRKMFPKIITLVRKLRVPGSVAMIFSRIAEGSYDFFIGKTMHIWDYAAGQILVEEAGGKFINDRTRQLQIVANKKLTSQLRHLLNI